jgi:hypothetical protein
MLLGEYGSRASTGGIGRDRSSIVFRSLCPSCFFALLKILNHPGWGNTLSPARVAMLFRYIIQSTSCTIIIIVVFVIFGNRPNEMKTLPENSRNGSLSQD